MAGGGEGAAGALYRLRSSRERVEMRREAASDLLERLRAPVPHRPAEDVAEQARLAEARAVAVERALAEREPCRRRPARWRSGGDAGAERGRRRAGPRGVGTRRRPVAAAAVVVEDAARGIELLEHARPAGLGRLVVLVAGSRRARPLAAGGSAGASCSCLLSPP